MNNNPRQATVKPKIIFLVKTETSRPTKTQKTFFFGKQPSQLIQGPPKRPDTFENLIEIKRVVENN